MIGAQIGCFASPFKVVKSLTTVDGGSNVRNAVLPDDEDESISSEIEVEEAALLLRL